MSFVPGIPVPIGGIEHELGSIWKQSSEGKTRASLINLAVYSEQENSLEANSRIVQGIAGEHALRALLIQADPRASGSSAEAWITIHCYLRGAKGGQVCSEQIAFRLAGEAARSLQSVVFSHLDSDLPLVLWWQADFPPPTDGRLWRWVDRLLFDSREWANPRQQFGIVSRIADLTEARTVLCDLNWARSLPARKALAGMFDTPGALPELEVIRNLEIDHAPGHRTTALLLVGWLADRLGWHLTLPAPNPQFQDARCGLVSVTLRETGDASISRMLLESSGSSFELLREPGSDVYTTTVRGASLPAATRMVFAPREETRELLLAELARGGRHPLYRRAVGAIEGLLD